MKTRNRRTYWATMIFVVLLGASLFGQDDYYSSGPAGGDPPGRVARLAYLSGSVSFQPSGEDQWSQAVANYPLTSGDRIYTDRDGRAELETGNVALRLSSSTDVTTTSLNDRLVQVGLAQGALRVRAYEIYSGNSIEIDTPNAALTLLRPGSYRVETYPDDGATLVTVDSGDLEISGNGLSQVLHSGQSMKLTGVDEVQADWVSAPGQDDFDRWCGDRDSRYLSSNSRQYTGDYVPGYEDLDQYGQWEPSPDYGQVWYPAAVPAGWAPYRYGRWAWVEPWGWTWVEDEPWGFAPFHYGRWALIGPRWGWVPGPVVSVRPVYAPALVAFVGGPSAGVQVWFPLGPRDPFFPWYHHSDGYLRQVNVTNVRVNIVNVLNVRNVENVHYAYQRVAPTAVSTDAFRGGRPVAREAMRVDADAIGRARIIPHPEIQPDVRAVHAGAPQVHPPVERTRPRIESRTPVYNGSPGQVPRVNDRGALPANRGNEANGNAGRGSARNNDRGGPPDNGRPEAAHNSPPTERNSPPAVNRDDNDRGGPPPTENRGDNTRGGPPPTENRGDNVRGGPPSAENRGDNVRGGPPSTESRGDNVRGGPPSTESRGDNVRGGPPPAENRGNNAPSGPPQARRPLVTKAAPPPQNPPFQQRQEQMQNHPGRPLEPQQMDNVRRGQPAGQMHDREFPSHQGGQPQPRPQNSSSAPRSDDHGKGRPH